MNGAESLVRTLVGGGVKVCFANPGTSEMHVVAALVIATGVVVPQCGVGRASPGRAGVKGGA
jgi:thiamine pyrophosphate-dependent acetolactate synthase large subunit-like protein